MKRLVIYFVVLSWVFAGCEDVYVPDIDDVGSVIVADARIVNGRFDNYITLTESQGFNDNFNDYPSVLGGEVFLIDDEGKEYKLPEHGEGRFYVYPELQAAREYMIQIKYGGNTFESSFEKVPGTPVLDSVYGIPESKVLEVSGANDADDFRTIPGVQIYADMKSTPEMPHYRFTAEKVLEYTWSEVVGFNYIIHYYWNKSVAGGIFNIATPPEYSSSRSIIKHPLYFFKRSVLLEEDSIMTGWIMVLYQHAIFEQAYSYYDDLNAQLDSEGRIFDPVYVQARSNIKCTSDPDEIVLGNFEISNVTEHRYLIKYVSEKEGYRVEKILDRSPIPWRGETIDIPPDFWVQ